VATALVVVALAIPGASQAPALAAEGRPGGVPRVMQREEVPQGFAIHETATTSSGPFKLIPHQAVYSFGRRRRYGWSRDRPHSYAYSARFSEEDGMGDNNPPGS
jgi:hypothetical protein